jgi:hypothetical protein
MTGNDIPMIGRLKGGSTKKDRRVPVFAKQSVLKLANFGFCGLNYFGEAGRIVNSDLGKHLAVEFDFALVQSVDEAAIADAIHTTSRIDANSPKAAEVALLVFTVHIGHGLCAVDGFSSCAEKLATRSTETLGEFQAVISSAA